MRQSGTGLAVLAGLTLSGCMSLGHGEAETAISRFLSRPSEAPVVAQAGESETIAALQARSSLLPPESAFAHVADATLAANARAAEAELRGARLRAAAANKNWLPQIGPNITLSSLSDVVAQLLVEQVLFDNGRKKAERAFAAADVEVAAVTLADDTNQRVLTALDLYLTAEQARERAALEQRSLADMEHFEWIMAQRVAGGISDRSDLNVIRQKLSEIRATLDAQNEVQATALAELNAMAARPLDDVRGVTAFPVSSVQARPLPVLTAEAEMRRDVAEARMARAGFLPGVKASGTLGDDGSGIGINVGTDQLLGLGTGDSLKAIEAEKEAAARRVAQAEEDANRSLRRAEQELIALSRQVDEARGLTTQAETNLDLFQRQYKAGQRQVMDVVGVYETFALRQTTELALRFELARTQLELAAFLGLLADGARI